MATVTIKIIVGSITCQHCDNCLLASTYQTRLVLHARIQIIKQIYSIQLYTTIKSINCKICSIGSHFLFDLDLNIKDALDYEETCHHANLKKKKVVTSLME